MSNSDGAGLGLLILGGTIGISIFSGVLAWDWIEPQSFGGAIVFLIAWSVLSYVGHLVVGGIVALIAGN